VSKEVRATLQELSKGFPQGLKYEVALDTTKFVQASIDEVVRTFFEAVVLVVLVVFVFLHSLRLTIIPTIAVPVSILGAMVGMLVFGFSVNMLTLFGMILAIGLVVDDAIVVVENTERNMVELGLSPKDAAIKAMKRSAARWSRWCWCSTPCSCRWPSSRHHRRAVQAVRGDHRHLGGVLGLIALTLSPALAAILIKASTARRRASSSGSTTPSAGSPTATSPPCSGCCAAGCCRCWRWA